MVVDYKQQPFYQKLEPDFLDRVWCNWMERHYPNRKFYAKRYRQVYRQGKDGSDFENWLWSRGGKIEQNHGIRYIVFFDEDNLLQFILENM